MERLGLGLILAALLLISVFGCARIEPYPTDYDADQRRALDLAHALAAGETP